MPGSVASGTLCITSHWGAFVQPLLQWKGNNYYIFWVCVCSPSYPACNAHAPYCHLWPGRIYHIFPHYFINGTILKKNEKCVLISSSSSIGTTTLVGFGLLNCRWAFSAGRFYRVPLPAARQTPNLEENQEFRAFQLSPQEAPQRLKRR
jgi:hypothetical protein